MLNFGFAIRSFKQFFFCLGSQKKKIAKKCEIFQRWDNQKGRLRLWDTIHLNIVLKVAI